MPDAGLALSHRSARPPRRWRQLNLAGLTALTAYSTALGWQARVVSYPLYRAVGDAEFAAYHRQYNEAIPPVVVMPGFASFLAGAAFYWTRPPEVPPPVAAVVSVAGLVSIASTVFWAVPMHDRLDEAGRSPATVDSLLRANLLRTAALTGSTLALVWSVWHSSGGAAAARA
ncbi:hypothetical protein SAMN05660350_00751 [Geodermatophilus obscurus]|uniref:DUF1772 domain-containing protein n=1 Tax=Geodermatophilus obscurus TaxID=1861 RepID=A0A1M7SFP6_9ACTN|nr:hypothetical protein [Geodermatophilus obscurus]SHN57122.1 hypothetical protein SAMN05660350_00751 [Geodermatophilus obscurus]